MTVGNLEENNIADNSDDYKTRLDNALRAEDPDAALAALRTANPDP